MILHLIRIGIIKLMVCCLFTACVSFKSADSSIGSRTIDNVLIGNTESELEHQFYGINSRNGFHNGGNWRDAAGDNGGYFQYTLQTDGINNLSLWILYWGNDQGNRDFIILIDDNYFASESIGGRWNENAFFSIEYPIPANMIRGKKSVSVKLQSSENNIAGGIYGLRMLENRNKIKQQKETKIESLAEFIKMNRQVVPGEDIPPMYEFKFYTDNSKRLKQIGYHFYLPVNYDESIAYPLVIFLSIPGLNSNVLLKPDTHLRYIDMALFEGDNYKEYPCIVLVPVIPEDQGYFWVDNYWDRQRGTFGTDTSTGYFGEISPALDLTMGLIDWICQEYSVDQRKIYIAGTSRTATGVWDALSRFPQKFAAGFPVGNTAPPSLVANLSDVPLWYFIGDADSITPVEDARKMVEALKEAGNTKFRYTEYEGYNHLLTCTKPWFEDDFLPWMFSQTNNNAPYPERKTPVGDVGKTLEPN